MNLEIIQAAPSPLLFSARPRIWWAGLAVIMPAVAIAVSPSPTSSAATDSEPEKFEWSDLLPTAWQENPRLHFTVTTELSEAGKKLPEVTPEHPAYFQLRVSGYREVGDTPAGEKTLKAEEIEPTLVRALATSGYQPAKPDRAPSLLVTYRWGTHNLIDPDNPDRSQAVRNILDRALLVGGEKFAGDLGAAYREAAVFAPISKNLPPEVREFTDPINLLKMRDSKTRFLVERTTDDIYFIVAAAYDYKAFMEHRLVLLWRTRVTVTSQGVTQGQTLPTMIATAGPFFGKETDGAEIIGRHTIPRGHVEIGTPTVVKPADAPAQAPAEKAK